MAQPATFATPAAKYGMLPVAEALAIVLREAAPLEGEEVDLRAAAGRVLAQDVVAPEPVPPFRASIKDGYAVAAADGPGDYDVAFEAWAGAAPPALARGQVAYIGTGGPVPEGADAVVQIEDTQALPPGGGGRRRVRIQAPVAPGLDIRQVGCDMAAGEVVLRAGTMVHAAEVGILATVGAARVQVHRAPRVGVLSTGDEVQDPRDSAPGPGQIRDANRDMLLAAAMDAGAQPVDLGVARDAPGAVEAALDAAAAAGVDVLLSTGGVSMGDRDCVKGALEARGTVFFGKVLMKPGKPCTFARLAPPPGGRRMLAFGLPGNPVSSLVTFYLFALPALRAMQGWADPHLRRVHARTRAPLRLDPARPEYHRAVLSWDGPGQGQDGDGGGWGAESTGGQLSSRLLSLRSANALLELPQLEGVLPAGSVVPALLVGDLRGAPQAGGA